MERPAQHRLERQNRLQVDTVAPSQDRTDPAKNIRGAKHGDRFGERVRLHVQRRQIGSVLLLPRDDHMV